ncbi:MAG: hypothetical protein CMM86_17555 [Rhodovulum sp.]|nr:hypothetical protein [Rhodovulum sp.]
MPQVFRYAEPEVVEPHRIYGELARANDAVILKLCVSAPMFVILVIFRHNTAILGNRKHLPHRLGTISLLAFGQQEAKALDAPAIWNLRQFILGNQACSNKVLCLL